MVKKFRLGGLYWCSGPGYYVECTRKTEDIAELTALKGDRKALAYDGDSEYEEAKSEVLERHVAHTREKVLGLDKDLREEVSYLGKLTEVWPNVNGREQTAKIDISVSDKEFAKMNRKALREMSVLNTDTGKITEYAEDGTVKAEYGPARPEDYTQSAWYKEQVAKGRVGEPKTLGEHKPGEEME